MTDIIQRLKDASEGSRELDVEIAKAAGWTYTRDVEYCWTPPEQGDFRQSYQGVPMFSRSIDAAMSLVNEHGCDLYIRPSATTARCYPNEDEDVKAISKSPALAICIASLSARKTT